MDLSRYFKIALRWWWLVVLSMLLSAGMSYWYSQRLPKIYSARATLSIGSNILESPNPDVRALTSIVTLAEVYAELAKRPPLAQAVIDKLGLDLLPPQLGGMINTSVIPKAQLLEIYVMDVNPKRAQLLANTIAEELILQSPTGAQGQQQRETFIHSQLNDLQLKIEDTDQKIKALKDTLPGLTSAVEIAEAQSKLSGLERLKSEYQTGYNQFLANLADASINRLAIFETAIEPTKPISPNIMLNVLIATAAGLVLAVSAIILLEFFDDALVWQPGKTQTIMGLPVLGAVTKMIGGQIVGDPNKLWSAEADRLRTLRSSILLAAEGRPLSTLLITSSSPGEGKSFLAANLAVTAATPGSSMASVLFSPGSRIILIDADLRRPGLHEDFDMPNLLGLADVLAVPEAVTEKLLDKALKPTGIDNLQLLPAGRAPLDPGALLNSPRLAKLLELLKTKADLVIIDSAPLLDVVDTKAIANVVDGVVLVVYEGRSRGKNVKRIIEYFEGKSNKNLLGVVFNGVKPSAYGYSPYSYRPQMAHGQPSLWRRVTSLGRQPSAESEIITIAEVADQLGISQEMAHRWCESGRIPASRSGLQWVVRLEDLNNFISVYQQGTDNGESKPIKRGNSLKEEGTIREKKRRADEGKIRPEQVTH
jgi:capsular exopolysaccharide synthesis family protein